MLLLIGLVFSLSTAQQQFFDDDDFNYSNEGDDTQNQQQCDVDEYFAPQPVNGQCVKPSQECFIMAEVTPDESKFVPERTGKCVSVNTCAQFDYNNDELELCTMYQPGYNPSPLDANTNYIGFVFGAVQKGRQHFYNDKAFRYYI